MIIILRDMDVDHSLDLIDYLENNLKLTNSEWLEFKIRRLRLERREVPPLTSLSLRDNELHLAPYIKLKWG